MVRNIILSMGMLGMILASFILAGTATQVSQYGITWTFDKAYETGQFANGDYWVVGPITINSITPAFDGTHNGWEVNPTSTSAQGFDTRASSFNAGRVPNLPYAADTNQSIIKSISVDITQTTCRPCLRTAAVLTVVPAIPPDSGRTVFRPPYFGTKKPYYYTTMLQTNLLPSLAPVANTVNIDTMTRRYQRVCLDHQSGWSGAAIHPTENMPEYGADVAIWTGEGALRLTLNETISQKMPLLIAYLQIGIDLYHDLAGGSTWPANGGHASGRKLPIAFTGMLLQATVILSAVTTAPYNTFQEDGHLYWSPKANNGAGQVLFGDPGSDYDYWRCAITPGTLGNRTLKDPYGYIDGGARPGGEYQLCCNSMTWKAHALMLHLVPLLKAIWNYDYFLVYEDRWVNFGAWAQPDSCAPPDLSDTTASGDFNADTSKGSHYGKTYGPDRSHPGECIKDTNPNDGTGRFPGLHGTNKDQGGYGSSFANAMWTAYRSSSSIQQWQTPVNRTIGFELEIVNNPLPPNCLLTIRFNRPGTQKVAVSIYNLDGDIVKEFPVLPADVGWRKIIWDGKSSCGQNVKAGLYYVRCQSGTVQITKKIIIL